MKRQYTPRQMEAYLKSMTVVVDSREQVWPHIEKGLETMGYPCERGKLDIGDYTCKLPDLDGAPVIFSDEVVIERKACLDEIASNFTVGRRRFENEFLRAKAAGVKVFLLIENAGWTDVLTGNYRSGIKPNAFAAALLSWQAKYNLTIVFCRREDSARMIAGTLYYWLRANLEGG